MNNQFNQFGSIDIVTVNVSNKRLKKTIIIKKIRKPILQKMILINLKKRLMVWMGNAYHNL